VNQQGYTLLRVIKSVVEARKEEKRMRNQVLLFFLLLDFVVAFVVRVQQHANRRWTSAESRVLSCVQTSRQGSSSSSSCLYMAKGKGGGGKDAAAAPTEFAWKPMRKGIEDKMAKSVESIASQFATLRAGGANPAMLDRVFVDSYGTPTPLKEIARVAASGSQQLVIEPFDKAMCKEIEKAISMSDLNLTPTNDGSGVVRINIPPLTEDRRKELVKQAKVVCEDGKVAIRNHRRDAVDKVRARNVLHTYTCRNKHTHTHTHTHKHETHDEINGSLTQHTNTHTLTHDNTHHHDHDN